MKFLVIRLHSWPHIAAAMHVVAAIRHTYPDAEIQFVTSPEMLDYVQRFESISKIHVVKGDIAPVVFDLLAQKFTHLIDLQCNSRTFYIRTYLNQQYNANLIMCKYKQGFAASWRKLDNNLMPALTTKMLNACSKINLLALPINWTYKTTEAELLSKNDIPMSHSVGYYTIELLESSKQKNIEEIITAIKMPVMLVGNEKVKQLAENIKALDQFKIYNACGKFSDAELVQLLDRSKVNCVETAKGLTFAMAVSKPVLTSNALAAVASDTGLGMAGKVVGVGAGVQEVVSRLVGLMG
jgi:ADP-heptose:LPS heptosyltransferase